MKPYKRDTGREQQTEGRSAPQDRQTGRILGIVPNSWRNRIFWTWALTNLVLTFLPVWDVAFNSTQIVGGLLPLTILWSYLVFASNMMLGIVLYFTWARRWAEKADWDNRFARLNGDNAVADGEEG